MQLIDLLAVERVRAGFGAATKTDLLAQLASLLAGNDMVPNRVHEALQEREALGSTGLGKGTAIPHARIEGIHEARAAFVRMDSALPFGSSDGEPVDLVMALLVPSGFNSVHLQLLAEAAELFSDAGLRNRLRHAGSANAMLTELAHFAQQRPQGKAWTD